MTTTNPTRSCGCLLELSGGNVTPNTCPQAILRHSAAVADENARRAFAKRNPRRGEAMLKAAADYRLWLLDARCIKDEEVGA